MIKYDCSHDSDHWYCYMTELWNDYGTLTCKTLLQVPDDEQYLVFVICGINGMSCSHIVSVPDIEVSFYANLPDLRPKDIFRLIIEPKLAISIVRTIEVMWYITDRCSKHWDITNNFADLDDGTAYRCRSCLKDTEHEDLPF